MKNIAFLILIVLASKNNFAQWTLCNGPLAGDITCIGENKNTNTLFAGTFSSGLFRFNNSNYQWESLSDELPSERITQIAALDSIIFVGTGSDGLYKSIDDGNTWSSVSVDTSFGTYVSNIFCSDSVLLISDIRHLFISVDAGLTFNMISQNLQDTIPSTGSIYQVIMEGDRIFLTYNSYAYNTTISFSDDLGQTWQKPVSPHGWIYMCNNLRAFSNKIYIIGTYDINLSNDFGLTWDTISTLGIPSSYHYSDIYQSGDTILIGSAGIYISTDSGLTYNLTYSGLPQQIIYPKQIFNSSLHGLIMATRLGIYNTYNSGSIWNEFNNFLTATSNNCMTYCNNELFVGTVKHGVFGSSDSGNTWTRKSIIYVNSPVEQIYDIISVGNRLIAGANYGIYYSDNNGNSWTRCATFLNSTAYCLKYDQGKLYVGGSGGLYYSTDSATSWTEITNNLFCQTNPFLVKDSLIIFENICTPNLPPYVTFEIIRSDDYGTTFSTVGTSYLSDIEWVDSMIIAANFYKHFIKSYDLGVSWNTDSTFGQSKITDIYVINSKFIFLGTDDGKIYFSNDKGISWIDKTYNFNAVANKFIKYGNNLYIASTNFGIWKTDISSLVGVDNIPLISKNNFKIYPNPSNESFTLFIPEEYKYTQDKFLSIFDNMGKLVYKYPLNTNQNNFTFSLEEQKVGIYYILINGNDMQYVTKIIHTN